jgi:hypothetical protein
VALLWPFGFSTASPYGDGGPPTLPPPLEAKFKGRSQKEEGTGQRVKGREQRAEDEGWRAESRGHGTDGRKQGAGVGGRE